MCIIRKGAALLKIMKKRKKFICCVAVILVVCMIFVVRSRKTDNVFDQLYLEVKAVRRGGDSVLISGTETAYADYDVGQFQNIQILDLDMAISIDKDSLYLLFFNTPEIEKWNTSYCDLYRYDVHDKKLYGEESLDYLKDNFLFHYFKWCDDAKDVNEYSLDKLGEYTFTLQEMVTRN